MYVETPSGLLIPERLVKPRRVVGVDLFAGAGGFSLGVEAAGVDVAVAVDGWPTAAMTYAYNLGMPGGRFVFVTEEDEVKFKASARKLHKHVSTLEVGPLDPEYFGWNRAKLAEGPKGENGLEGGAVLTGPGCRAFIVGDMRDVTGDMILLEGQLRPGEVDMVFGGPPCQGFSIAGRQDPHDPRNNLVLEFVRVAIELAPIFVVIENVPPLVSSKKFRPLFDEVLKRLSESGYDVTANILDASDYGVPQRRRRALIVASMAGPIRMPFPTNWPIGARADGSEWDMLKVPWDKDDAEKAPSKDQGELF